jgi:hypothetical protein
MYKKIIALLISFLFLITIIPITVISQNTNKTIYVDGEQPINLIPTITLYGGIGVRIEIEGIPEGTIINISVENAKMMGSLTFEFIDDIEIRLNIIDFMAFPFDSFILHISIDSETYSYQCRSFLFIFVYGITPIDDKWGEINA